MTHNHLEEIYQELVLLRGHLSHSHRLITAAMEAWDRKTLTLLSDANTALTVIADTAVQLAERLQGAIAEKDSH